MYVPGGIRALTSQSTAARAESAGAHCGRAHGGEATARLLPGGERQWRLPYARRELGWKRPAAPSSPAQQSSTSNSKQNSIIESTEVTPID